MKTLALSGWGQPYDALSAIAPDATHVDYAHRTSIADALEHIAHVGKDAELVIGWSLGGQLAVRALAAGMLKARALVLIAAPFQFVANAGSQLGMKRDLYEKFRDNYGKHPARTLGKAWELVIKDDARAEDIRRQLEKHSAADVMARDWLLWLNLLDGYSCAELPLADFPKTLLVHGDKDAVVGADQMEAFARTIPHARTQMWKDCGHAPHWHDANKLKEWIAHNV